MTLLNVAPVTATKATIWPIELLQGLALQHLIPLLAVGVWLIEYRRRAQPASDSDMGKHLFRQLMPELAGLTVLCGLVTVLLVCRREDQSLDGDVAWTDVKHEWPLLMTADSLIGLQAMVRLVFLLSASLRRTGATLSPLDGEPAAFFLLAALVRVALLILSPPGVYHLDGPLGGDLNIGIEVTSCLLLLPLGLRLLQKGLFRVVTVAVVATLLAGSATRNHFSLADKSLSHLDMLFSLVVLLEIVAGVAFYINSAKGKGSYVFDAFTGFAHFMLPLQQALPTYFLLVAFAPPFQVEASLVGKGRPFELLQGASLVQIGMYIAAGVVYTSACFEEKQVSEVATLVPPGEAPEADECVICMGGCKQSGFEPRWRRLKCGHHYHEQCIFQWLKKVESGQRCPMCRRHVSDDGSKKKAGGLGTAEAMLAALDHLDTGTAMTEESVPLMEEDRIETARGTH